MIPLHSLANLYRERGQTLKHNRALKRASGLKTSICFPFSTIFFGGAGTGLKIPDDAEAATLRIRTYDASVMLPTGSIVTTKV